MSDRLTLSVGGREYVVPSPPATVGLALQALWVLSIAQASNVDPPPYAVARLSEYDRHIRDVDEDALGPAWDQMVADGVSLADLRNAAHAAFVWIATGDEDRARRIAARLPEVEAVPLARSTRTASAS